jgi:predicted nucleic acid-binding protein
VIYLDTCALVKLVHPEPETGALRDFLRARVRLPKFTSAVTLAELPRAVRRANHDSTGRAGKFLEAEIEQTRRLLGTLRMIELTRGILAEAGDAGGPYLRTLDAVHLVAAERLSAGLAAFVTYDKRLAVAAQQAGLPVESPT